MKGQVVIPIGLSLMPNIENCWRCYLATIIAIRAYCCEAVRSAIAIWLLQLAMLRSNEERGRPIAMRKCPTVRLSVTLRYGGHIWVGSGAFFSL